MDNLIVYCADIGSINNDNFGWAKKEADGSSDREEDQSDIASLARSVAGALDDGCPVALGFECPLFVPLSEHPKNLGKQRPGEGKSSWSAGAGAAVLTTELVQVAWTLRKIRCRTESEHQAHLSWEDFRESGRGLYLWEAFVSGKSSGDQSNQEESEKDHIEDARIAAEKLWEKVSSGPNVSTDISLEDGENEDEAYSLVGAALLRTGWRDDPSVLRESCLVARAWKGNG